MRSPGRRRRGAGRGPWIRSGEAGLALAEMLVAVALIAVAIVVALALHDAARRSLEKGDNAAELQQSLRVALDRVDSDLAMAGHNVNPDGDPTRPDEALEGAFDAAIVIRSDSDADDPSASEIPERDLATSGAFSTVTTGNDEIVAYALAKPDGTSADTLTFFADLGSPRSGAVRRVDVPRVSLSADAPPYTLYRITFSNADGSAVRTPLAENVRSLAFTYVGWSGARTAAPGGDDSETSRSARRAIRRIGVELVGLTRDPDPGWEDLSDPDPRTRRHRKLRLAGELAPRNLGLKGVPDLP